VVEVVGLAAQMVRAAQVGTVDRLQATAGAEAVGTEAGAQEGRGPPQPLAEPEEQIILAAALGLRAVPVVEALGHPVAVAAALAALPAAVEQEVPVRSGVRATVPVAVEVVQVRAVAQRARVAYMAAGAAVQEDQVR
jgi:hypothetical protein